MSEQLSTPILFIVFSRPQLVQLVFDEIKKHRPKYLFVASDGPRKHVAGEVERNKICRSIISQVDWDCEVKTRFLEENQGAGRGVSSAISWFFEHVEEGIIFEEDCLPHTDFFPFCAELLEKFRDNEKVMHIGGNNFQFGNKRGDESYYFSKFTHIWGWATWKRAWDQYSFELKSFSKDDFKKALHHHFPSWVDRQVFWDKYLLTKRREVNTWDYQWLFQVWVSEGLAINPQVNLVENIGFGEDALHCTDPNDRFANVPTAQIMPLVHPEKIHINLEADKYFFNIFWKKSLIRVLYRIVRRNALKMKSSLK